MTHSIQRSFKQLLLVVALLVPLSATGCDDAEEIIDCADICSSVENCAGDDFDQTECVDSCEDQPSNEIDACDACLDEEDTCSPCTIECAPLLI